jgi:nucleotide-binding universal stress UspA family protein
MSHPAQTPNTESRRIVVGVDGSAGAESAALWAAGEAHRRELPLTIVHAVHLPDAATAVLEPDDLAPRLRDSGRAVLARTAADVNAQHPDLAVTTELSDLSPAHALEAASRAAATVVTGTRGRGGFAGMLLGSVSRSMAAHARCPLIVVPEETQAEAPTEQGEEIVLGAGPKHSDAAIRYAFEAARKHGAALTVVRAWWPAPAAVGIAAPGGMYAVDPAIYREAAESDTRAAIKPLHDEYPDVNVRIELAEGNAVDVLLRAARGTRLLVVGARRHHGPLSVGAGYVVDGVIAHSPVPVAVVPTSA